MGKLKQPFETGIADAIIYVSHNRRAHKLHHNVGTCLRHVSMQLAMYQRIGLRAKGESTGKTIVTEVKTLWRLVAVGND